MSEEVVIFFQMALLLGSPTTYCGNFIQEMISKESFSISCQPVDSVPPKIMMDQQSE